jgi:UDP-glucose 4-epimerase
LVIGRFLNQRLKGESLTIRGDGSMKRDYTHVDDVVRANILAMTTDTVGHGEVINIGNGHPRSVNEVAKLIGGTTVSVPVLAGEMPFTHADNTKAKHLLGWSPTITLEEGIAKLKQDAGLN